jgi:hypothetical protein
MRKTLGHAQRETVRGKTIIAVSVLLAMWASVVFGQNLSKQQKEAAKQPRALCAIAARDGETLGMIYNYLYVGHDEPSIKYDYVWYWICVKKPCQLFTKGDKVTINLPKGTQERNVRVAGKMEKHLVGQLCGGTAGCFEAAFLRGEPVEAKKSEK